MGILDFVLRALRALRLCDTRTDVSDHVLVLGIFLLLLHDVVVVLLLLVVIVVLLLLLLFVVVVVLLLLLLLVVVVVLDPSRLPCYVFYICLLT